MHSQLKTAALSAIAVAAAVALVAETGASRALAAPLAPAAPAAALAAATAPPTVDGDDERRGVVPGEAIVRFEPGVGPSGRRAARDRAGVGFDRVLDGPRTQVVSVEDGVAAAVRRLERQPGVAHAQPNYRYEALAAEPPNDPRFGQLWGLGSAPGIGVLDTWGITRGAGQVIAVLDTGVALDPPHPDLAPNLWTGPGGVHGHDFVDDDTVPDDFNYHGTHVAATAAAAAGNEIGIAGVAPEAEVMAVRVLDGNGRGSTATIAAGILWATDNGADVINLSLGGPAGGTGDQALADAVDHAEAHDVVVVAAAGNETNDNDAQPRVPCALPNQNLICVAATTAAGALASYSNYGASSVDLGAPGSGIVSADVDYALAPGATDDFSSVDNWSTAVANGGVAWSQVTTPNFDGNPAASDSQLPGGGQRNYGQAVDPDDYAVSALIRVPGFDLTGERGCHLRFAVRYELEDGYDFLLASAGVPQLGRDYRLTGSSQGGFEIHRASIAYVDGQSGVKPRFTLISDEIEQRDGAYVDALSVRCRTDPPPAGSYVTLDGTSMATPHVAGVAALVRAAAPAASASDVARAIKIGGRPLAALGGGKTVTGCTADAARAIVAAGGWPTSGPAAPTLSACGATPPPPAGPSGGSPPAPVAPAAQPSPAVALLRVPARRTARPSRSGRFAYVLRASPGLRARVVLRTRGKVRVGARRARLTVARRSLRAGPAGRVRLSLRLGPRALRILRRDRRLALVVTVTARDPAGRPLRASGRLTLRAPRG